MASTRKATSAQAGSIRLPEEGVAVSPASRGYAARRMPAALLKLAVLLLFAAPAWCQQTFTGGPFLVPADTGGQNTIIRQTVAISVATASAIRSISIPLGFRGNLEFEFISQSGCVVDGTTVNPAGTVCSVIIRFNAQAPGVRSAQIRVIDGSGNITNLGISGMGFLPQAAIFPALASIVAGTGPTAAGYTGDGDVAVAAQLSAPQGVATDAFGNTYIADTANNVVRMLDAFGNITTVAGNGTAGYSGDGDLATSATLQGPTWLAVDTAQNLYIADSGNHVIRKVALGASGFITTVAGTGTAGFSGDGETAIGAKLNNPQGIVLDPAGNLYIVDSANNRIRKVDAVTGVISTIAGVAEQGFDAGTAKATSAHFYSPIGIALDAAGNIYIADAGNNAVRELLVASGNVIVYAGTGSAGKSGNGGAATAATLNGPTGLAFNAAGDLYIADSGNSAVRRIERSSGNIDLYLGESKAGYGKGIEPSNEAGLTSPTGLAFDVSQNLIAADTGNNVVRKASPFAGSVQFSATAVGQTTTEKSVTVSNIGTSPLQFAGLPFTLANGTADNFNLTTTGSTPCGGSLAPGAHCNFTVSFAPQTTGFLAGEVDAHDSSLAPNITTVVQPVYLLGGLMQPITITPTSLPDAPPNTPYSSIVTANGGFGALALEETGTLPPGITGTIAGNTITFSGTPTTNGLYPFTVFATDALGNSVSQALSIKVIPPPIMVNVTESIGESDVPNTLSTITVNVAEAISTQDAINTLSTITVGVNEAVQVSDAEANLPTLTVNVAEAISTQDTPSTQLLLALSPAAGALPDASLTNAYSTSFTASGGSGTYTFSRTGTLPKGLNLTASGATYTLSGTPTQAGNYSFSITVNDGQATPITNNYTLAIQLAPQNISVGILPTLTYGGGTFSIPVSSTSGLPVTLHLVSGPASGSSPYTITGAGTVMFHATQEGNATYAPASLDFRVVINPATLTVTADSFTRNFNQPNPALSYQVSGFVLGQNASVLSGTLTLGVAATGITEPGSYPIGISTGTLTAANYSISFVPGTLTIRPSSGTQTITFGVIPNLPVGISMTLTAHATSGLAVKYSVSGPATLSGSKVTPTGPGRVTVTASQAGNANYAAAPDASRSFTAQ